MPQISVIVPVYKVEAYLRECIDSILSQTFSDFECILVDDGSPDKCPQICDEYALKDFRVKVIHKKNGGLSDARNAGIDIAQGEYLTFVDSDDVIHPQMFEILYNGIGSKKSASIVKCGYSIFEYDYHFSTNYQINYVDLSLRESFQKINLWMVAWGCLYKRNLFNNLRYPIGRLHEDESTTYKLFYYSKNIIYTDKELYFYRKRNDSIMSNYNEQNYKDIIVAFSERIEFFREKQHPDINLLLFSSSSRVLLSIYEKDLTLEKDFVEIYRKKLIRYYSRKIFKLSVKNQIKLIMLIFPQSISFFYKVRNMVFKHTGLNIK